MPAFPKKSWRFIGHSSTEPPNPEKGQRNPSVRSAVKGDQLSGAESKLNASIPEGEDVRRELAARRGDEVQHREAIARFQKTIDGLREELAAKSCARPRRSTGGTDALRNCKKPTPISINCCNGNRPAKPAPRRTGEGAPGILGKEKRAQAQLDRDAQESARRAARAGAIRARRERNLKRCASVSLNPTNSCKRPASGWRISKRGMRRSRNDCANSCWK